MTSQIQKIWDLVIFPFSTVIKVFRIGFLPQEYKNRVVEKGFEEFIDFKLVAIIFLHKSRLFLEKLLSNNYDYEIK